MKYRLILIAAENPLAIIVCMAQTINDLLSHQSVKCF
jgi:hypothetical protein